MGKIITFYSFKGGVGRSMALANVAILLARWGHRVLIVDWDLEAPGIESYFREYIDLETARARPGVVDLLRHATDEAERPSDGLPRWGDMVVPAKIAEG